MKPPVEIVHESIFASLFEKEGFALDTPEIDHDYLNTTSKRDVFDEFDPLDTSLSPRAFSCGATNAVITDKTENFVDWDVQVSDLNMPRLSFAAITNMSQDVSCRHRNRKRH